MQRIILGRNGNQPFEISGSCVSREHAEITIDDHGIWTLKDLDSISGSFVRDEKSGIMKRISCVTITPMSFICLGPENSTGCFFYARQVLNPGNFSDELEYMNDKEDEFDREENTLVKKGRTIKLIAQLLLAALVFVVSGFIFKGDSGSMMAIRLVLTGLVPFFVPFVYDEKKIEKDLKQKRKRFHHCPNPECSNVLKIDDIKKFDCSKCHLKL